MGELDPEELRRMLESGEWSLAMYRSDDPEGLRGLLNQEPPIEDPIAYKIDVLLESWITFKEKDLGEGIEDIKIQPVFMKKLIKLIKEL